MVTREGGAGQELTLQMSVSAWRCAPVSSIQDWRRETTDALGIMRESRVRAVKRLRRSGS